ncbi:MAG: hypothetical protein M1837_002848 [Sclerophora amabilis]|nr:MAG: hypothetical protein M1837_002848 [Sclerophora amabilis]
MLEQQQEQLVTGLQELYRRFQSGEGRAGSPLADAGSGHPLTHDILQYLGALRPDRGGSDGGFEEDLSLMQQRLFENGAAPMIRHASSDTESDHTQSSPYDSISGPNSVFKNSFDSTEAPQTPPTNDPFPPIAATTETPRKRPDPFVHPLKMHSNMDLDQFQRQHWASSLADFAPSPDLQFLQNSVSPGTFNMAAAQINRQSMPLGSAGPCLIPEWNEDEEFKALLDQGVA